MADSAARIGPQQLGVSPTTIYTVDSGAVFNGQNLLITNGDTSDRWVTVSIGVDVLNNRILDAVVVKAKGVLQITGLVCLLATESIQAYAEVANKINLTWSGVKST